MGIFEKHLNSCHKATKKKQNFLQAHEWRNPEQGKAARTAKEREMAKITIETDWLITPEEDVSKAFQVIKHTYGLLREAKHLDMVELIKANVWVEKIGGVGDVHFVEYQIIYSRPSFFRLKGETLKTVARWQSQWDKSIGVWKNQYDYTSSSNLIGRIKVNDADIETFAKALLQAMQIGFHFRSAELANEASVFSEAEETMYRLLSSNIIGSEVVGSPRGED